MKRMIGILIFLSFILLLKGYVYRGFKQATPGSWLPHIYIVISILSLLIFAFGIVWFFKERPKNMSLASNVFSALALVFIFSEGIAAISFVFDDLLRLIHWLYRKVFGNGGPIGEQDDRRRFIKLTGLLVTSIPFAAMLYGLTRKYAYKIRSVEIDFRDLPDAFDGFTISQFSDFHAGSFDSPESVREGLEQINALDSDVICFTGDIVNNHSDELLPYKQMLSQLKAREGVYSILGNHDYSARVEMFGSQEAVIRNHQNIIDHHKDVGFDLLLNTHRTISRGSDRLAIVGVENWGKGFLQKGDLSQAIDGLEDDTFSVLLSHDPSHWDAVVLKEKKHIHLTLSGHTHGMQFGVEIGKLKWSPVQYLYPRWAGLYDTLGRYLYVNRGFGFLGFAGRVGIPPEITKITLRKRT